MKYSQLKSFLWAFLGVGTITTSLLASGLTIYAAPPMQESTITSDASLKSEAERLETTGHALILRGDYRPALNYYNQAWLLYLKAHEVGQEAFVLMEIGKVYSFLGKSEMAVDSYNQALLLLLSVNDRKLLLIAFSKIGLFYSGRGEKSKALDCYTQALELAWELKYPILEAAILSNIGKIHSDMGEYVTAMDYYARSLQLLRDAPDHKTEAGTLNNVGQIYDALGEKHKALEYFNRAVSLFEGKDLQEQGVVLSNIGKVYSDLGDKQEALKYYEQSFLKLKDTTDLAGAAKTVNNMGLLHLDVGDVENALKFFNSALAISTKVDDLAAMAVTVDNIGSVHDLLGDKQQALEYYERARRLAHAASDPAGEATTLNNIGKTYSDLGGFKRALDYFNQALSTSKAVGNRSAEAIALNNIGRVYSELGDKQKALSSFNDALPVMRDVGDCSGEAAVLNNIGLLCSPGEVQKALDYFNQSLPLLRDLGDRSGEATVLNNIGGGYLVLGQSQKALYYFDESLKLSRAVGDRFGEAISLENIGSWHERQNRPQQALDSYRLGISVREKILSTVSMDELKILTAAESFDVYQHAVLLHIRLSQPMQAFDLAERARSRAFLDQLGNFHLDVRKGADAQLVRQEQALKLEIDALEKSQIKEGSRPNFRVDSEVIRSLTTRIADKQREYEDLLTRLKLNNPEYASLRSINPSSLQEVQTLLDQKTTLVSYFVTTDKTLAFVITKDHFRAVELAVKGADLKSSINWFRGFANLRTPQPESLKRLYGWLIAPIKQYLKTRVVGVIPHGILHYLPFAALTDGQNYFGDEHTIFYLPSASVLPFIQKKSKPVGNQLLAIAQSQAEGLPALQYADDEANVVANLYNTEAFVAGNASKSEVLKRAGEYSIIHIAAHAKLNTSSPLFSRIMIGSDKENSGGLEVREVYDLDLSKASLVVLSACETQLGAQSQGDDMIGLNRAFIYAGTPTVIASLWTVDDESTDYLMKGLYTHLKEGMSKAESLRAAQSDTRKQYPHPYYWAGFVLTGDPGAITTNKRSKH